MEFERDDEHKNNIAKEFATRVDKLLSVASSQSITHINLDIGYSVRFNIYFFEISDFVLNRTEFYFSSV